VHQRRVHSLGFSPTLPIHSETGRAQSRVVTLRSAPRPMNKNSPGLLCGDFQMVIGCSAGLFA
jgi:hypothetical protein